MKVGNSTQRIAGTISRVWSWGGGTDSTAGILLDLKEGKQIDEIIFADPGFEQNITYDIIPKYTEIFESYDVLVTILKRPYTIVEHFKEKQMVPLGWVNPYCSSHFKRDLIRPYLRKKYHKVIECIGHSYDEPNRIKFNTPKWLTREYPNFDRKMKREDLIKILPILVGKSACKFCPNKSMDYFTTLKFNEPEVIDLMVEMENNPFNATFKLNFRMENLRDQTSLTDWEDFNCSEYCYT